RDPLVTGVQTCALPISQGQALLSQGEDGQNGKGRGSGVLSGHQGSSRRRSPDGRSCRSRGPIEESGSCGQDLRKRVADSSELFAARCSLFVSAQVPVELLAF